MPAKKPSCRVAAVLELRRSNAAQPHTHRQPRSTDRRNAIAANHRGE